MVACSKWATETQCSTAVRAVWYVQYRFSTYLHNQLLLFCKMRSSEQILGMTPNRPARVQGDRICFLLIQVIRVFLRFTRGEASVLLARSVALLLLVLSGLFAVIDNQHLA